MKSVFRFGATAAVIAATLVGCDWGGVSSNESWNDAYAWANFSGTYKLVTKVVIENKNENDDTGSSSSSEEKTPAGSDVKTYKWVNGGQYQTRENLVPGSITVTASRPGKGATAFQDNGEGLLVCQDKSVTASGSIAYTTGVITLTFTSAETIDQVTISYAYYDDFGNNGNGNGNGNESSNNSSSSVSSPITWLNVTQKGNLLTLQDNDGRTYSGKITGASCPDADASGYVTAGHIRFSFEATCTANAAITLSGSLSGNWSGAQNETSGTISDRTMDASFTNGGSPIQFQAVSGSVTVVAKTVTPAAGETM